MKDGAQVTIEEGLKAGVGVHHGRIPRALASKFVRMFNSGDIPILLCTSTLIEGVNTAAKSIIIYDKTIAKSQYDFFTFSNIKGRAGRLGQHHVGNVYLFHAPPGKEDVDVAPPLFGDLDDAPDEFVVHIDDDDATPGITERVSDLTSELGVTPEELRRISGIGVEHLLALKKFVTSALRSSRGLVVWSGNPTYDQMQRICEIVCDAKSAREFGCRSAKQLTLYLNKLRMSATLKSFFHWYASSFQGTPKEFDNIFKFLRACEFNLPEYLGAVEIFLRHADQPVNYSPFIAQMSTWFRAEALKNLEEEGVPIQISERFLRSKDSARSLGQRLRNLASQNSDQLLPIEREWILEALPR